MVYSHNPNDHDKVCDFCKAKKGTHRRNCQFAILTEMTPEEVEAKQAREQAEKDGVGDKFNKALKRGMKPFKI